MTSVNKGSALLIIVAVISVATLITVTISHQAAWATQIITQKIVYAKNYRALQSLLAYGIDFAKHNYANLLKEKQDLILLFNSWHEDEKGMHYNGKITMAHTKQEVTIAAQLKNKEQLILTGQATLEQVTDNKKLMVKDSIIVAQGASHNI